MATIQEIRQQYPQYNDLPDNVLADRMYHAHYSDMPREQFDQKIGLQPQNQSPNTIGDYASDVGKSAATGLAQGAIGLATVPFDTGAMVGNYLTKKAIGNNTFGIDLDSPTGRALGKFVNMLPDKMPSLTGSAISAAGVDYQPQTIPGKFANTIASFAPAFSIGNIGNGASLIENAKGVIKNSLLSGGASESAGQLTEGTKYEPYARVAGAVLPSLIGRAASPVITDETKIPAMNTAKEFDIPVYRNQVSDSGLTRGAASLEREIPLTGAQSKINAQTAAWNKAVLGTIGETGDAVTPEVLNKAHDRITGVFNDILSNNYMKSDSSFQKKFVDLIDKGTTIGDTAKEHAFSTMANNIIDKMDNGILPGETYQGIRSQIGRLMRNHTTSSPELGSLQNIVDEQFSKGLPVDLSMKLNQARGQYRNILALEGPVTANLNSPLSPSSLHGAVKSKFGNYAYGGDQPLEKLARLGNLLKDNYPNSGTAQRSAMIGAAKRLGALGAGGAVGYEAIQHPEEAIGGTVAAVLMSRFGLTPFLYQQMTTNPAVFKSIAPSLLASSNKEMINDSRK